MLVSNDKFRYKLTPTDVAKRLIVLYGVNCLKMHPDEWGKVVIQSRVTARERELVEQQMARHFGRVLKMFHLQAWEALN